MSSGSSHQLWGVWHVQLDPVTMTANITPLRQAMFTCNVTQFMQPPSSPTNMVTLDVLPESDPSSGRFVVNVNLQHPFAGLNKYNGFDVRGIFITNSSVVGSHDPSVSRAGLGDARLRNPDGFTRFWNPSEFLTYESVFGYTKGKLAPPIYPTATVNAYKYFADNLGADAPVESLDPATRGIFRAGSLNSRRYDIQFAMSGGTPQFDFNYAVDASWSEPDPSFAPDYPPEAFDAAANVQEAFLLKASDAGSSAYYVDIDHRGGEFKFDLEIFDRQGDVDPNGVPGEVSAIWIEGDSLAAPVDVLGTATVLPGSTVISSIFEVDLANLNLNKSGIVSFFATVESSNPATYEPAVPGGSSFAFPDAPLAGYFVFTGNVKDVAPLPDYPTEPILIDPDHPVLGTHFAIDNNGLVHTLAQDADHVYWSYSEDNGNTWINKGIVYTAGPGNVMYSTQIAMTSSPTHVFCLLTEWDGQYATTFTSLTVGRLDSSNLNAGWEFKLLWQHTDGYSPEQNYSGLQIAVDNNGAIMIYAMLYNYASFISRYGYAPNWDALTGTAEIVLSLENGSLLYYYPQTTPALVADSHGNFFMVFGGNFNDYNSYNGNSQDYGMTMIRYTPSTGHWRFVQTISHPGGSFYWNSWAAGLTIGSDDRLYWVGGYQHDNCGYYGLQGGYFVLSYGTGLSTGDHDFIYNDPINDYHNAYADCDLTYEYWGYDLMFLSSSIGVDPSTGGVVITYQRSYNDCHVYAIRNDGAGWSDPPVQIDGGHLGWNPYGRMLPSGWFLVAFTDTDYLDGGTKLPYFVAWK
jgi:hypothetical protein